MGGTAISCTRARPQPRAGHTPVMRRYSTHPVDVSRETVCVRWATASCGGTLRWHRPRSIRRVLRSWSCLPFRERVLLPRRMLRSSLSQGSRPDESGDVPDEGDVLPPPLPPGRVVVDRPRVVTRRRYPRLSADAPAEAHTPGLVVNPPGRDGSRGDDGAVVSTR